MVNQALCEEVIKLSDQVKAFILGELKTFERSQVEFKGLNNMVSYVDKQAEVMIVERLSSLLPEAGFLAEEGTGEQSASGLNWVVDPLDGTTNFIHGLPFFSVSTALMQNNEVLLGVVNDFNHNECYHAIKGGGAFCNGNRIQVSQVGKLSEGLVATGFPYEDFVDVNRYMDLLKEVMKKSHGIRRIGSAALDLAYVACGRFEAFFEYNLNPWDVAAGVLLVEEAGGEATDFSGKRNAVFGRELIAAGHTHKEMLDIINSFFLKS